MNWNIFKRNKTEPEIITEPSAVPVLFGNHMTNSANSLSAYFAAKELICNSVAQLPIRIKRNNELDLNHSLNFIFRKTLISKFNFVKSLMSDIIDYGQAFAYIKRAPDGTPIALVYCEHGSCMEHYDQRKQELYYTAPFVRKGKIEAIDILHFYKNSRNGVSGVSVLSYAHDVIKLSQLTDDAAANYYKNGCAVNGALTVKGSRRGSKEAARQSFMEAHGPGGSGLVILDDSTEYTPMSSSANDAQMLEARSFNVDEIARYFNINPVLIGDLTHTSYNTIEAANIEFVTHTLMPYIALFEDELNRKLIKPSEYGIISIDLDESFLLRGDKNATANYLKNLVSSGIMTVNEARNQLGLTEKENCDDLIIAFTNIQDNKINNSDEEGNKEQQ